jgi:hypothetical protein
MALVALNLKPSKQQLRDFGDIALCMCNLIGLVLLWAGKAGLRGLVIFSLAGLAMYIFSRISTGLIKPVYQGMMIVTFPIGWVVSHIVMGIFYYGIVTLIAVIFRIIGRDPLCRNYDPQASSYWIARRTNRPAKDYFHQF